jgi:hypothetical protein
MKTRNTANGIRPIVVPRRIGGKQEHPRSDRPSPDEARKIARAIRPRLDEFVARYDEKKYGLMSTVPSGASSAATPTWTVNLFVRLCSGSGATYTSPPSPPPTQH